MSTRRVIKGATEWAIVTSKGTINRFPFDVFDPKGTKTWSEKRNDALAIALQAYIRWSDPQCMISSQVKLIER